MSADGQIDASARTNELLGDLGAGRSGPDNQDGSGRKLVWRLVSARVDVEQRVVLEGQIGDERSLVRAGRDHNVGAADRACRSLGEIASSALVLAQGRHSDAAANRSLDLSGIRVQVVDDLGAGSKSVRVGVRERAVGKPHRPVGELESQAIPAFTPPALADAPALEHQMRPVATAQHVAHCEPGLAAADDQGFDMIREHGCSPRSLSRYPASRVIRRMAQVTVRKARIYGKATSKRGLGDQPVS